MKRPFTFIFSILAFWMQINAGLAQDVNGHIATDSTILVTPNPDQPGIDSLSTQILSSTESKDAFIQYGEVILDYLKLFTIPLSSEDKAEVGVGIYSRNNFGINVEGGYGAKYPEQAYKNAEYVSKGYYGRVGLNYLYKYAPGVHIYIGAKYGKSFYEDEGTYEIGSDFWGNYKDTFHRTGLQADWFEVILGSERQWKGNLYLGFQARLRMLRDYDTFQPIEVYFIPGYGRTMYKTTPALNLYIKYIIGRKIITDESGS